MIDTTETNSLVLQVISLPYIHGGKWKDGTQIIPEIWVKEATRKQVDSVSDGYIDNMMGYGYQFWRNPVSNSYRADGLFGQRCFMFPEYDALVVLTAERRRTIRL